MTTRSAAAIAARRATRSGGGSRAGRSDRRELAVQVGIAIGAGLGLAARYLARRAASGRTGLVDWERAALIAESRLRRAPGALTRAEVAGAEPAYAAAMARIVPLLETRLGAPLPGVVERHAVVDRAGWARANLVTFEQLVGRLEDQLLGEDGRARMGRGVAGMANRFVTTQQIGFLMGYLGNRVLGQYDVALLSAEAPPGRLLFVEENIRATAASLDIPLDAFRTWIALHETTHAFELEAHPWLRPYLAERLERQLASLLSDARTVQSEGLGTILRRLRSGGGLLGLLTAEQRRLFHETQLLMSLLEGFSDWVMDDVGAQLVPDVARIRERFEVRRSQRRRPLDRLIARVTGLDLKLEQYRRGERFVSGVARVGGREAIGHLWDGPWALPSDAEFDDPGAWVRRVVPQALTAGSAW